MSQVLVAYSETVQKSGGSVYQALGPLDAYFVVNYAFTTMDSKTGSWLEVGLFLFTFLVIVPSIAAAIGYAAWKGVPKNFSREMYWTAFAAAGAVSVSYGVCTTNAR